MIKQVVLMACLFWAQWVMADGYSEGLTFGRELLLPTIKNLKIDGLVPGFNEEAKNDFDSLNEDNIQREGEQAYQTNSIKSLVDSEKEMITEWIDTHSIDIDETMQVDVYEETVCQNSLCDGPANSSSTDFATSLSYLSAMTAAGNDVHKEGFWIFTHEALFNGTQRECRKTSLHYNDCCKDKGWGQDIHLAGCNDEEKKLGHDKEHKLCHYVGDYCKSRAPIGNACLEKKKVYCCFGSILARIVVEGAHGQQQWPWGEAKAPTCDGLSPARLSLVDFEQLDFSDYEDAVNNKLQKPSADRVIAHIQAEANGL